MSRKHLKLEPHSVAKTDKCEAWWYEDNGGIDVYWNNGKQCGSLFIPWATIRNALKRKDKK